MEVLSRDGVTGIVAGEMLTSLFAKFDIWCLDEDFKKSFEFIIEKSYDDLDSKQKQIVDLFRAADQYLR